MKTIKTTLLMALSLIIYPTADLFAHGDDGDHPDVKIHVNPKLKMCDFELSSDLTQTQFKRFTKEVGHVGYFDPLTSARPLGKYKFDIALVNGGATAIDQTSGAWNNTFHHPDSNHWLGDVVMLPGIQARMGLTDKIDIGLYYSHSAPLGGKYSFIGADIKYSYYNNIETGWAAAVRASYVQDVTIKDLNIRVFGLDALVSKSFGAFTPYAGVTGTVNHAKELSERVNLSNETRLDARGTLGLDFRYKFINLGAEAAISELTTFSLKIGATF
jgi:hypothetical protein